MFLICDTLVAAAMFRMPGTGRLSAFFSAALSGAFSGTFSGNFVSGFGVSLLSGVGVGAGAIAIFSFSFPLSFAFSFIFSAGFSDDFLLPEAPALLAAALG
jgi:hypothetical protein